MTQLERINKFWWRKFFAFVS